MNTYLFEDQQTDHELRRLKLIEAAFDAHSKKLIKHRGISTGVQCLEIGSGTGRMFRWMGCQVGESGLALGVDKDIKYLSDLRSAPFEILEGNIAELNLNDRFDISTEKLEFLWIKLKRFLISVMGLPSSLNRWAYPPTY